MYLATFVEENMIKNDISETNFWGKGWLIPKTLLFTHRAFYLLTENFDFGIFKGVVFGK
jgi:hypothetical protein